MVAFTALRTSLQYRLGITAASTAEVSLEDECLNAAIAMTLGAGVESLHTTYVGTVNSNLSTTVTAHSTGSAAITLNSVTSVYPGDFLTVTTTGVAYLIHSVNSSTKVCNVGAAVPTSLNGLAVTVTRRSIALPTEGRVYQVIAEDGDILREGLLDSGKAQFETTGGDASAYRVGYAENLEVAYMNLYPAPASGSRYLITQARANAEDADIPLAAAQIQEVLARAYFMRTLHSQNPALAVFAEKAFGLLKGLRNDVGTSAGVLKRG